MVNISTQQIMRGLWVSKLLKDNWGEMKGNAIGSQFSMWTPTADGEWTAS